MTQYTCNPITVDAFQITGILDGHAPESGMVVMLDNGEEYIIDAAKTARMIPVIGDYLVRVANPDDQYEYLNPKRVFEAKYSKTT